MKIVSVLYNDHSPFDTFFPNADLLVANGPGDIPEDAAFIILHGGADISPSLYNAPLAKQTWADAKPSHRDSVEWACIRQAADLGVPIFGICRGAQMLCAAAGGRLIQHVNNHGGYHDVVDNKGNVFEVNSIHHQMQYPFEVDHQMLAWSTEILSDVHIDPLRSPDKEINIEPEAVYYPKLRGFGVQWHPEMLSPSEQSNKWVRAKIKELFNV